MFGLKYKIIPVNPAKGIYKIKATPGTMLKMFAPSLVYSAAIWLWIVAGEKDEVIEDFLEEPPFNLN